MKLQHSNSRPKATLCFDNLNICSSSHMPIPQQNRLSTPRGFVQHVARESQRAHALRESTPTSGCSARPSGCSSLIKSIKIWVANSQMGLTSQKSISAMVVCQLLFTLWSKYIHCCYDENTGLREKKKSSSKRQRCGRDF